METSDWLTVVGWVVTFALGVVATLVVDRARRRRKEVAWSIVSESELVSDDIANRTGLPVRVLVGDQEQESLSVVTVRVGSRGNEVIEDLPVTFRFNQGARQIVLRTTNGAGDPLWDYKKHVNPNPYAPNECLVHFDFINPEQTVEFEFLLGGYELGSVDLDCAAPGVSFTRRDISRWEIPDQFLGKVGLGIMGVRYDPTVAPMIEIAGELRSVRRQVSRLAELSEAALINSSVEERSG